MANEYVNKVTLGNEDLIDLTGDTATAADVAEGKIFHLASGAQAVGTASGGSGVAITTTTVTIAASDWSNNTCTKSVTGVTATNDVLVTYAPASKVVYTAADIYCIAQGAGTLTFACTTTPTEVVTVNVMIIDIGETVLTDLTGTTWYLSGIDRDTDVDILVRDILFTANNIEFNRIDITVQAGFDAYIDIYKTTSGSVTVYDNGTWKEAYRTISITGGTGATNTDLIAWLQENATQVS